MREIKFDYVHDGLTVQWIPRDILVGKIRCHVDPEKMPGTIRYMALIEVEPTGEYELTSLIKNGSDRGPTFSEHTAVREYLESLGFYGLWRRAKRGFIKVVANERGNVALNLEEVKMSNKVVVSMDYFNKDGVLASNVTATYNELAYVDVVTIQGAVVGALHGLGESAAANPSVV